MLKTRSAYFLGICSISRVARANREGYQSAAAGEPGKAKNLSGEGSRTPTPYLLNVKIFSLHTSARLGNILCNKPLCTNTVPLQIKTTKGLLLSYQSYLLSKPLHFAAPVTYFHFECTACHPQGTCNFRTTLFNSPAAGRAKPSHSFNTINPLPDCGRFRDRSSRTAENTLTDFFSLCF